MKKKVLTCLTMGCLRLIYSNQHSPLIVVHRKTTSARKVVQSFMSVDPLADDPRNVSWSPYTYTWNNPLKFTDPTGMAPEDGNDPPWWAKTIQNIQYMLGTLGLRSGPPGSGNIGARNAQEAESIAQNSAYVDRLGDELQDVQDVQSYLPGGFILNPNATDAGFEIAGVFLPGIKFAKGPLKGVVKFSDEVVEFIQGTGDKAIKVFANLPEGFRKVTMKGTKGKIYTDGKTFISPDLDGHNGGVWKAAKSVEDLGRKETRLGTYNKNFERIGD